MQYFRIDVYTWTKCMYFQRQPKKLVLMMSHQLCAPTVKKGTDSNLGFHQVIQIWEPQYNLLP